VNHALQGPATEGFAVSLDELIDPLEDDDLGSERLDPPFFQAAESRASYGWRSARPDSRLLASSNPARGPPSS
jgi:hypothetical protein